MKFQTHKNSNFGYIIETVTGICAEEIGNLGIPVPGASLHYFQKKEYIGQIHLNISICLSNQILNISIFEN